MTLGHGRHGITLAPCNSSTVLLMGRVFAKDTVTEPSERVSESEMIAVGIVEHALQ